MLLQHIYKRHKSTGRGEEEEEMLKYPVASLTVILLNLYVNRISRCKEVIKSCQRLHNNTTANLRPKTNSLPLFLEGNQAQQGNK